MAATKTALLLVDVQRDMLEGPMPVPDAATIRRTLTGLLARARSTGCVVVHIQNDGQVGDPDEPYTEGWELVFPTRTGPSWPVDDRFSVMSEQRRAQ